ncbi:MAG: DUF1080 domain-containing protein [bacterium]|nr:DUF1080 domain-containing protein [bacterium]
MNKSTWIIGFLLLFGFIAVGYGEYRNHQAIQSIAASLHEAPAKLTLEEAINTRLDSLNEQIDALRKEIPSRADELQRLIPSVPVSPSQPLAVTQTPAPIEESSEPTPSADYPFTSSSPALSPPDEPTARPVDSKSAGLHQPGNTEIIALYDIDDAEFEPLFDEMNAEHPGGWIIQGLEKAGPKVEEGGVLKVGGWDYWAVISKKQFGNFVLRFDAKFEERGNSGVLIHTPLKEIYKRDDRVEIQLDATMGEPLTPHSNGAIERFVAPTSDPRGPIGEWDAYEIVYLDGRVWVRINQTVVINGFALNSIPTLASHSAMGSIALQRNDYKRAVYFRNPRVKRL